MTIFNGRSRLKAVFVEKKRGRSWKACVESATLSMRRWSESSLPSLIRDSKVLILNSKLRQTKWACDMSFFLICTYSKCTDLKKTKFCQFFPLTLLRRPTLWLPANGVKPFKTAKEKWDYLTSFRTFFHK